MIIHKIEPQGYCGGVKHALKMVYESLENSSLKRPLYMLGSIIHNQHVIDDLLSKGIILLEDSTKTRIELLDEISSGTVILSAHGVAPDVKEKIIAKGLTMVDTTCKNVEIIHKNIQKYLALGYTCAYIGTKNHPECEGVLGINPNIKLIQTINDIDKIKASSLYVTNQTTLSANATKEIYQAIRNQFPNACIDDKICMATTIRQEAMQNQPPVDLCIVVGDPHSSNTKQLVEVSRKQGIQTILVSDKQDLLDLNLSNIHSISVSSGASTPEELVNEIIKYMTNKK